MSKPGFCITAKKRITQSNCLSQAKDDRGIGTRLAGWPHHRRAQLDMCFGTFVDHEAGLQSFALPA